MMLREGGAAFEAYEQGSEAAWTGSEAAAGPPAEDPGGFHFDRDNLMAMAASLRAQFEAGDPFPHVYVKDFLPAPVAEAVAQAFPRIGEIDWQFAGPGQTRHTNDPNVEKVSCSEEARLPPVIRQVLHELNSATFLDFVEAVTGFKDLIPDPWFGGGGLHSTGRGGRLMIHADADRHPNGKLHQILNLIYYATPDWQDEWGGALELWNGDATACVKSCPPVFNSMVLFFTGSKCYHGHPHPLQTPPGVRRNSLAVYYYTTDRQTGSDYEGHSRFVTWMETTEHDGKLKLRTRFRRAAEKALPGWLMRKAIGVWIGLKR